MTKTTATHVGVLVGSLRKQSISRKVAHALIERSCDSMTCEIIEIGDLPLYNEDLDARPPRQWTRFRKAIATCDALLFVTPEYNRSIPGALKNATDIASRPEGENLFDGMPAAIVSVTPYTLGAFGANHALRQSFVYLNLRVMQQPEAYIGKAADLVGEGGKIRDRKSDKLLRDFMHAFDRWTRLVTAPDPAGFATFMEQREVASNAYIQGDSAPLASMTTGFEPATFFPPSGERVSGVKAVNASHHKGARAFAPGSTGRFEVLASGTSGTLAYWSGVQHARMKLKGKQGVVPMQLRTTEVFRFEAGDWKLVHRHADFIKEKE